MAQLERDVIAVVQKQAPRLAKRGIKKEFKEKFDALKQEMIKEFLNHPISVELAAGPSSANISGTLGGVSNLFAFIGFSRGDDPLFPIIQILESTDFREESIINKGRKIGINYSVNLPEAQTIFNATPLPWATGRSWAKGMESGLSGLGYLLRKSSSASRSGVAVQSKKRVRGGRFQNIPYISQLLNKYKKKFDKLK